MTPGVALAVAGAVAVYAAVQSVFGVGLLVFGTPTLLLLGLPFGEVLAYLLPCSLAISAVQVAEGGGLALDPLRRKFLLVTAPVVVASTLAMLAVGAEAEIKPLVGAVLLATAALRSLERLRDAMSAWVRRHLGSLLALLGVVHGISNLGGGILTWIVGSLHADKREIRRQIAFCYGLMASAQLATLFAVKPPRLEIGLWAGLPLLALASYFAVGQLLFRRASPVLYRRALTGLIAAFGGVLVVTS